MSNVFAKSGVLFVPVPACVVDKLKDMTEAEIRLYLFLCRLAQKHSAAEIQSPAFEVHDWTGLHSETVSIARRALEQRGLVRSTRGGHGLTVYQLTNPLTRTVLPPLKGFRGLRIYEPKEGRSSRTSRNTPKAVASSPAEPVPWDEIGTGATKPVDGSAVSKQRFNRQDVTAQPLPGFSEVHENTGSRNTLSSLSEKSLKTGVSEVKGEAEQSASPKEPERAEREKKGVRDYGSSSTAVRIDWAMCRCSVFRFPHRPHREEKFQFERDRQRVWDPSTHTVQQTLDGISRATAAEADPVVCAMKERFGARLVTIVDLADQTSQKPSRKRIVEPLPKILFVQPAKYTPKSSLNQPTQCPTHGTTSWWERGGQLICDRCHPNPFDASNWSMNPSVQQAYDHVQLCRRV